MSKTHVASRYKVAALCFSLCNNLKTKHPPNSHSIMHHLEDSFSSLLSAFRSLFLDLDIIRASFSSWVYWISTTNLGRIETRQGWGNHRLMKSASVMVFFGQQTHSWLMKKILHRPVCLMHEFNKSTVSR